MDGYLERAEESVAPIVPEERAKAAEELRPSVMTRGRGRGRLCMDISQGKIPSLQS